VAIGVKTETSDIVIVGGGAVGSAAAYYLTRAGALDSRRIIIVEQDPSYALSSTARSAGGLRQQFSTPENIAMSQLTLALVRNLTEMFGPEADVGFREQGYLILASVEGSSLLASTVALQRAQGADILFLDTAGLAARFPWLNTDGVAAGSFGQSGEGWLDPVSLMTLFRTAARAAGVQLVHDQVTGIRLAGRAVAGVTLASGKSMACGALINAAGPSASSVAALAGLELPVEPRKRFVYVIDCRNAPPSLHRAPLTVDLSGVWFRPEGRFFLTGISPQHGREPPAEHLDQIDDALFEDSVWPRLTARIPAFQAIKVINAWAGYYDYNTLDQNAVIGPHPDIGNFYFANGFSGHGVQQAAAAGRALAELIVHGHYQTIDLKRFGYERIAKGDPLPERNVI
jgi:FAD-dependent oxidoreductase domain-containing protein 1